MHVLSLWFWSGKSISVRMWVSAHCPFWNLLSIVLSMAHCRLVLIRALSSVLSPGFGCWPELTWALGGKALSFSGISITHNTQRPARAEKSTLGPGGRGLTAPHAGQFLILPQDLQSWWPVVLAEPGHPHMALGQSPVPMCTVWVAAGRSSLSLLGLRPPEHVC